MPRLEGWPSVGPHGSPGDTNGSRERAPDDRLRIVRRRANLLHRSLTASLSLGLLGCYLLHRSLTASLSLGLLGCYRAASIERSTASLGQQSTFRLVFF